jgi:hypothetical protein
VRRAARRARRLDERARVAGSLFAQCGMQGRVGCVRRAAVEIAVVQGCRRAGRGVYMSQARREACRSGSQRVAARIRVVRIASCVSSTSSDACLEGRMSHRVLHCKCSKGLRRSARGLPQAPPPYAAHASLHTRSPTHTTAPLAQLLQPAHLLSHATLASLSPGAPHSMSATPAPSPARAAPSTSPSPSPTLPTPPTAPSPPAAPARPPPGQQA